jgi:hypothetical protein
MKNGLPCRTILLHSGHLDRLPLSYYYEGNRKLFERAIVKKAPFWFGYTGAESPNGQGELPSRARCGELTRRDALGWALAAGD